MKHLTAIWVTVVLFVSFSGTSPQGGCNIGEGDDPNVAWVLAISKEAAHKIEPRNSAPKAMPRKLAEELVKETTDRHLLSLLVVYAFAEGSYSLDPELPGDCKDENGSPLPAGTPKCTPRLLAAGTKCCDPTKAQHWCTLQVEPKPASLEACVHRGAEIMSKDITTCPAYPGSVYATGGTCKYNYRIDWRARIAAKLEVMETP